MLSQSKHWSGGRRVYQTCSAAPVKRLQSTFLDFVLIDLWLFCLYTCVVPALCSPVSPQTHLHMVSLTFEQSWESA